MIGFCHGISVSGISIQVDRRWTYLSIYVTKMYLVVSNGWRWSNVVGGDQTFWSLDSSFLGVKIKHTFLCFTSLSLNFLTNTTKRSHDEGSSFKCLTVDKRKTYIFHIREQNQKDRWKIHKSASLIELIQKVVSHHYHHCINTPPHIEHF